MLPRALRVMLLALGLVSCSAAPVRPATRDGGKAGGAPTGRWPLHTEGRYIMDARGERFRVAGVNWYGTESGDFVVAGLDRQPLSGIAQTVRELGFNTVRIPWSNELLKANPLVLPDYLEANPELKGQRAMSVLDNVIAALAAEGLAVLLVNHVSDASWCCTETDGNGLWFTERYLEELWVAHWREMARRFIDQPAVVGMELRNELRQRCDPNGCTSAVWGGNGPLDWRRAATRAADAILEVNSNLLIVVDGLNYATDLRGPYNAPMSLSRPNRLVYAAHDYSYFHAPSVGRESLADRHGRFWGYLITQNQHFTAPVVVTEFGTCTDGRSDCGGPPTWFDDMIAYIDRGSIDWIYWPLNGTQASGEGRLRAGRDFYGVLDPTWSAVASPTVMHALRTIQTASTRSIPMR